MRFNWTVTDRRFISNVNSLAPIQTITLHCPFVLQQCLLLCSCWLFGCSATVDRMSWTLFLVDSVMRTRGLYIEQLMNMTFALHCLITYVFYALRGNASGFSMQVGGDCIASGRRNSDVHMRNATVGGACCWLVDRNKNISLIAKKRSINLPNPNTN